MKRVLSLFGCIALFLCPLTYAAPVDPATAAKVAANFYKQSALQGEGLQKSAVTLNDVTSQTPYKNIFVFNAGRDNGFVLVAGDDRSLPILGYSPTGTFDYARLPQNARSWIGHYEDEIAYIKANDLSPYETTAEEWESLRAGTYVAAKGSSVEPLIKTKWGQSCFNDDRIGGTEAYNKFCPYSAVDKGRALTGCVATAMAQIMKYWEWPDRGTGFHQYVHPQFGTLSANFGETEYDWENMPEALTRNCTEEQVNAVATLIYQCGVAADMNYSVSGSGANDSNAETALKTYFKYAPTLTLRSKNSITNSAWISMLKSELDHGRPIYYSGCNNELKNGHAFVCDGYDANNLFHFNWGWNGNYNNEYYSVSSLTPSGYDFSYYQSCIIGIQPNKNVTPTTPELSLYAPMTTGKSVYEFGEDIVVNCTVANYETADFNGYLLVAVCDAKDNYPVAWQLVPVSLPSKKYVQKQVAFAGYEPFVSGNYYAVVMYGTDPNDVSKFVSVKETSSYKNGVNFSVKRFQSVIELSSAYQISTGNPLYRGRAATISVTIQNIYNQPLSGTAELVLSYLGTGKDAQLLGSYNLNSLKPNVSYKIESTQVIDVPEGEYFICLYYKLPGLINDWSYAGCSYYDNPMRITVSKAPMSPDSYEPNNSVATAYSLGIVQSATKSYNINANIHNGDDVDFYKIDLPKGYNYTISAQLNDSYNSSYTAFTGLDFLLDGKTIGEYDNEMSPVTIKNGGTAYFRILGYNGDANDIGTYQLLVNITRVSNTGIEEVEEPKFAIYPNPAYDKLNLVVPDNVEVEQLDVITLNGQNVRSFGKNERELNVGDLSSGFYLLRIRTKDAVLTEKWIKR